MRQTNHYKLPLHEPYTQLTQTIWDENQNKLDQLFTTMNANISKKANQTSVNSSVNSLTSRVTALEKRPETVIGSYIGNDTDNRTIKLGFAPKGVYLESGFGSRGTSSAVYGGVALPDHPLKAGTILAMEITTNGFTVYTTGTNINSRPYYYIAFK